MLCASRLQVTEVAETQRATMPTPAPVTSSSSSTDDRFELRRRAQAGPRPAPSDTGHETTLTESRWASLGHRRRAAWKPDITATGDFESEVAVYVTAHIVIKETVTVVAVEYSMPVVVIKSATVEVRGLVLVIEAVATIEEKVRLPVVNLETNLRP
ncbi:hypothetical protein QAD02_001664 [Eretmocerus hayati]|uniref:Uncharacterized protein n=1 Tax=Eretmocerus hayati TaxID=131215 RepID=A0ACC2NGS6_9HYME|nr:hypothetical protein QAD02_001664 [Eretmocerus hayati]